MPIPVNPALLRTAAVLGGKAGRLKNLSFLSNQAERNARTAGDFFKSAKKLPKFAEDLIPGWEQNPGKALKYGGVIRALIETGGLAAIQIAIVKLQEQINDLNLESLDRTERDLNWINDQLLKRGRAIQQINAKIQKIEASFDRLNNYAIDTNKLASEGRKLGNDALYETRAARPLIEQAKKLGNDALYETRAARPLIEQAKKLGNDALYETRAARPLIEQARKLGNDALYEARANAVKITNFYQDLKLNISNLLSMDRSTIRRLESVETANRSFQREISGIATIRNTVSALTSRLPSIEGRATALSSVVNGLQTRMGQVSAQVAGIPGLISSGINQGLKGVPQQISPSAIQSAIAPQVSSLSNSIAAVRQEGRNIQNSLAQQVENRVATLSGQMSKISDGISTAFRVDYSKTQSDLNGLKIDVNQLKIVPPSIQQGFEKRIIKLEGETAKLGDGISTGFNVDDSKVQTDLTKLTSDLNQLKSNNQTEISRLKGETTGLRNDVTSLQKNDLEQSGIINQGLAKANERIGQVAASIPDMISNTVNQFIRNNPIQVPPGAIQSAIRESPIVNGLVDSINAFSQGFQSLQDIAFPRLENRVSVLEFKSSQPKIDADARAEASKLRIDFDQFKTSQPGTSQFRNEVTGLRADTNQLKTETTNIKTEITNLQKNDTEQLKLNEQGLTKINEMAIGLGLLTPLITGIPQKTADKINPNIPNHQQMEDAAASGTCRSFRPGGCARQGISETQSPLMNAQNTNNGLLNKVNTTINGANLGLLTIMDQKLGPQLPGGISGKLGRFAKWMQLDRLLNVLIWIGVVHNAYMLSNALLETLFGVVDNMLNIYKNIFLTDDDGVDIDTRSLIGGKIDELMGGIFGVKEWTGMKATWKRYVRIYQAAANIVSSIRSITEGLRNVVEYTAEMCGKGFNALRAFGTVGDNAYSWFSEQIDARSAWRIKLERLDDAASALESVTGEVVGIQENLKEIVEQKGEFDKALKELDSKTREDNAKVKDRETASQAASQSPDIPESATQK